MMINRRKLINLITGFAAANTIYLSLAAKTDLRPTRRRNLPFFLGWYDSMTNSDIPDRVSPEGIDLLMPYIEKVDKETVLDFLNAAEKAGVKVLLELYRPLVESENISGVKNFVDTYKKHPSVYGWYLYDEPQFKEPNPLTPDSLKRLYQVIKKEDQSKPVALFISTIDKIKSYADATDILMWDYYPCKEGIPEFKWASSYRRRLHEVVSLAYVKNKKFWNVLQAYGEGQFNRRLPTKAEFRYMFYLSVLAGADGLLFWTYYRSSHLWNELVLYPTIKEFRSYIPAIVKGIDFSNQVNVNKSDIEVKLFSIPNTTKYLMLVVNHNQTQINFTVRLNQKLAGRAVAINQKIITNLSTQASFNAILIPYEVRLYEIG